jgi:hypothetical protein
MLPLLRHSGGEKSFTFTAAVVSLAVVLAKVLLSGLSFKGVSAGTIDGGTIAAVLTPTLGAYVLRRNGATPATPTGAGQA